MVTDLDLLEGQFDDDDVVVDGEVIDDEPDTDGGGEQDDSQESPVFYMRWGRQMVRIDADEFSALDHGRFRQVTGLNLMTLQAGNLEAFAGALWLVLRRSNKKLRYQDVAKRVRLSHIVDEETAKAELGKAGGGPEA